MKNFIVIITLLVSTISNAQEWETNYDQAVARALESKHNIILVFSGSDWCAPCIKLDKNIWQSQAFQSYAKENWVLLRADFPRKKSNKLSEKQMALNAELADKYNKNGHFPLVVVLDPSGNVLGETSYKNISPNEYVALLKEFKS
tara:strand:+ start:215 stop:649 length:435 start_codon:yes stop_codon:yes gene_type:complete